jgi:ABC-type Fe3+/spermidine/putrescine transport system ATPase subunit
VSREELVRLSEVRLEGVGKRFGDRWPVRDVSLSVRPGELYTLLGPPGSGKTVLLRLLAGFIGPDSGRIVVDDAPVDAVPARQRRVGMVFPGGALWPHLSVFDNVAFGLRERGLLRDELTRQVTAALRQVGLIGVEQLRPAQLSDEQPQRVALARALVVKPRLLLLDEPLAGLAAAARARMRAELDRLRRDVGITTICATRDQAAAMALSSRIAVLGAGQIAQEGRPEDIYWRPRSRFVAEFVGGATLLPVRVVEVRDLGVMVETAAGSRVPVPSGGHSWTVGASGLLCLRPEALRIEEAERAAGGIRGKVAGHVFEGSRQLYEVAVAADTVRVEMLTSAQQARTFKPGDDVKIEISPETSILLPVEP